MKSITRTAIQTMVTGLLLSTLLGTKPLHPVEYGTNFQFKDLKEMQDDGWIISDPAGVRLVSNGIVLDGNHMGWLPSFIPRYCLMSPIGKSAL